MFEDSPAPVRVATQDKQSNDQFLLLAEIQQFGNIRESKKENLL